MRVYDLLDVTGLGNPMSLLCYLAKTTKRPYQFKLFPKECLGRCFKDPQVALHGLSVLVLLCTAQHTFSPCTWLHLVKPRTGTWARLTRQPSNLLAPQCVHMRRLRPPHIGEWYNCSLMWI